MTTLTEAVKATPTEATGSAEWFAAWLPKPVVPSPEASPESEPTPGIDAVRAELAAVSRHLTDPSAAGVRAAIPHLERAVAVFTSQIQAAALPVPGQSDSATGIVRVAIESLRSELAHATYLFENAFQLHANWATQLGINLDGTPRQLLYGRPDHDAPKDDAPKGEYLNGVGANSWEG
jgi:hypothetical protein